MGVYIRRDSPFYWLLLERPNQKALREKTRVLWDAPTAQQRKDQRQLADQLYHDRMSTLARGDAGLTGPKPAITVAAFVEWYDTNVVEHHRGATREREILKQIVADLGPIPVAELTRARILEWRTMRSEKASAGTVNRETDVLKHLLTTAVPDYLAASPIAGLKRLRGRPIEPAVLTRAQERRLLKVLDPPDKALVILALDTLMRLSDALRLEWAHDHKAYLSVMDTKTGRPYKVPVSSRLRKALNVLDKSGRYIFAHRRKATDERDWRGSVGFMLERACKAAKPPIRFGRKVGGITFHSLRHTGASRMVAGGTDLRTVQELGGWASLRQLSRYAHPTDQAKRKAVESVKRAGA